MFGRPAHAAAGLAAATCLGGFYYAASRPEDVVVNTLKKAHSTMDTEIISERERALVGKLVRPVFPTSVDEALAYRRIIALSDGGLGMTLNVAMYGGALLGAAAGIVATRRIGSWPLKFVARCVLVPPSISCGSAVMTGVVLSRLLYTLRGDAVDILVPLGATADAFARSTCREAERSSLSCPVCCCVVLFAVLCVLQTRPHTGFLSFFLSPFFRYSTEQHGQCD